MMCQISALFESPYLADRALARVREQGILVQNISTHSTNRNDVTEPTMLISYPYPLQFNTYYNNQANGLPPTAGNSVFMETPLLVDTGGRYDQTRLEMVISSEQLEKVKKILVNCHGTRIRSNGWDE